MITIRPARQEDIPDIKFVMYSVAYNIFGFDGTLEDSIHHHEERESRPDLENIRTHYFENRGMFPVALNGDQVIGSGALRKLEEQTAELKKAMAFRTVLRSGYWLSSYIKAFQICL